MEHGEEDAEVLTFLYGFLDGWAMLHSGEYVVLTFLHVF